MTERLAADPAGVSVVAAQVADETGIPAAHVEKDFWVTEVLRGVVASATEAQVVVVFKGGTSLSKAYRLIERFSEDVDVLVVLPDDATKGKRDGILKTLVDGAAAATGLVPVSSPAQQRRGTSAVPGSSTPPATRAASDCRRACFSSSARSAARCPASTCRSRR